MWMLPVHEAVKEKSPARETRSEEARSEETKSEETREEESSQARNAETEAPKQEGEFEAYEQDTGGKARNSDIAEDGL